MRTVTYKLEDLKKAVIHIGKVQENEATRVQIDAGSVFAEYPAAVPTMKIVNPAGTVYPPAVTRDGNMVLWTVVDSDLVRPGQGELQLTFTENSVVVKSCIGKVHVDRSIVAGGSAPSPVQDWVDQAEEVLEDVEEALEAFPTGGTTGQVLAKASNDDYDTEWVDQGSGGTTDYTELTNKPQIGGVTLTGNKSLSDLGAASAADVSAKYTKPAGGIPASDIADGVIPDPTSIIDDTAGSGDTDKTWSADKLTSDVLSAIHNSSENLETLANNGFYTEEIDNNIYLHFSIGQVSSIDLSVYTSAVDRAYRFLTPEEEQHLLKFDTSVYNILIIYVNNGAVASATAWLGSSPISFDSSITHTSVVINVKRIDGAIFSQNELDNIIYYTESERIIGNLATRDYVDKKTTKGLKCIYPDGFTSRIKPDIYFNGSFYADIDTNDYKLTGVGEVWVSNDGNDTTGTGAENNPYATITKALTTSAKTIHIKAGTYVQETHYSKWADLKGRNFIGHGAVVFQNDSAGHTLTATGSAYFENITFKHGNSSVNPTFTASCTEASQHICFVKCVFCDGGDNGLSVLGIDAVLVECVAHSNKLDGFNYHKNTSNGTDYIPNVIEINCSAYDNGSSAGSNTSCNGSTSHEGAKVIRINGEYYSCYGGIIADIANQNGDPTISVNYGVLAHESTVTGDNCASFWASYNTEMYLYDCSCYGGTYDITALNDAKIVSRRLTTGRDVPSVNKAETAMVYQY